MEYINAGLRLGHLAGPKSKQCEKALDCKIFCEYMAGCPIGDCNEGGCECQCNEVENISKPLFLGCRSSSDCKQVQCPPECHTPSFCDKEHNCCVCCGLGLWGYYYTCDSFLNWNKLNKYKFFLFGSVFFFFLQHLLHSFLCACFLLTMMVY